MMLDQNLLFDSAAAITTTRDSTNIIDLLNARDLGTSGGMADINVLVLVTTAFTSTGSATLQVAFEGSTDNSTYHIYAQSEAVILPPLGGSILNIAVPGRELWQGGKIPRYLKLVYTASATMTAGAVTAGLVADRQINDAYPSGFTVNN